ncbi:WD40-repeat-containing domain protein, partial [Mycena latifolia]
RYIQQGMLHGHHGSVNCLKATEDGKILASGGTDGVKLWDLTKLADLLRPNGAGIRGATSALLWIRREDEPGELLVYGTQMGYVVVWKQSEDNSATAVFQMMDPAEVTGLAFDAGASRLAVCHRKSTVQVHTLDSKLTPRPIFSVSIQDFVPKAIAFGEMKGSTREVMAFGYHDGQILTLNGTTGGIERIRQVGSMIGNTDYNAHKGVVCFDDPWQGPALYRLESDRRIKTFEVKVTKPFPRPRQVCFADDCSSVVSGSDHGVVYVFDRRTGQTSDTLRVDPTDWVQTVTATELDGFTVIIAARSRDWGGANGIVVWR